jgi:hypothetical protein
LQTDLTPVPLSHGERGRNSSKNFSFYSPRLWERGCLLLAGRGEVAVFKLLTNQSGRGEVNKQKATEHSSVAFIFQIHKKQ